MSNRAAEYTYINLWTTFSHLKTMYDNIKELPEEKDQALALRLAALTIAFFSLEAFLNHIISVLASDIWENEREHFSGRKPIDGNKYSGPLGKLRYVCYLCSEPYEETAEAIGVVKDLKRIRDTMAHAQTYKTEPADVPPLSYLHGMPESPLFSLATDDLLAKSAEHIGQMRIALLNKATSAFPEADLGFSPDSNMSGFYGIDVN